MMQLHFDHAQYYVVERDGQEFLYIVNFTDGKTSQNCFYQKDIDKALNEHKKLFIKISSNMPFYQFFKKNQYTYITRKVKE